MSVATDAVSLTEYAQVVHRLSAAYKEIGRLKERVEQAERFVEDMISENVDLRTFGLNAANCGAVHPEYNVPCLRPGGHGTHHRNGTARWEGKQGAGAE